MSLTPGTKLGPYEILAPLGAGGMGEVYRARDTKLGREVAIKVLPEAFAKNEERLARFEREARLLASLNHPNIATLYGLEQSDGVQFLVMEPADFRSDQFSLGAVLYEMAVGRRAFQADTTGETLAAIIRNEPSSVAKLNPGLPAPVRWIVERCLVKDPEERYGNTGDLAKELQTVRDRLSEAPSEPEVVSAPQPTPGIGAPPADRGPTAAPARTAAVRAAFAVALTGALLTGCGKGAPPSERATDAPVAAPSDQVKVVRLEVKACHYFMLASGSNTQLIGLIDDGRFLRIDREHMFTEVSDVGNWSQREDGTVTLRSDKRFRNIVVGPLEVWLWRDGPRAPLDRIRRALEKLLRDHPGDEFPGAQVAKIEDVEVDDEDEPVKRADLEKLAAELAAYPRAPDIRDFWFVPVEYLGWTILEWKDDEFRDYNREKIAELKSGQIPFLVYFAIDGDEFARLGSTTQEFIYYPEMNDRVRQPPQPTTVEKVVEDCKN